MQDFSHQQYYKDPYHFHQAVFHGSCHLRVLLPLTLSSGGVKVDGYLRSSDPHIYAVGEVASYEGGMVYGLWKPGTEQAEVRQQQYKAGPCIEDGHPNSTDGNPYNGFINPYYISG